MNPDQGPTSDTWQQPSGVPSEYHPISGQIEQPDEVTDASADAAEQAVDLQDEQDPNYGSAEQPTDSDQGLLQWQAIEGVDRDRPALWYVILAAVVVALIALALFVVHSYTFAILVPVMALALVVYVRRPLRAMNYTLSRQGVHIGDRLVDYSSFRAFSVVQHDGVNMLNLIPKKRFSLAEVLYFPSEIGESLVDAIAARLPMREAKPDLLDRVVSKLRL